MEQKIGGLHILAELYGCANTEILVNKELLKQELIKAVENAELEIVGSCFHKFSNLGVTGICLIAESHVSVHTWPEKNNALTLDIFTCNVSGNNDHKAKKLFEDLKTLFKPKDIHKQFVQR